MSTPAITYENPVTPANPTGIPTIPYGSFIQVDDVDLDNLVSFTLCGFIRPTLVDDDGFTCTGGGTLTGDYTGLAGQLWLENGNIRGTGFGIDKTGHVFARLETDAGEPNNKVHITGPALTRPMPNTAAPPWVKIKIDYDGDRLLLEVDDGTPQTATIHGRVKVPANRCFRIGARDEAPGDLTGCFSGRLDNFRLTGSYLGEVDSRDGPQIFKPDFTFNFEDVYGDVVHDSSGAGHDGKIIGGGTPGMEGRLDTQGLRLNHDQVFDAQFDANVAELDLATAPAPLPSGLYVIEAVQMLDGGFAPHLVLPPSKCSPAPCPTRADRWQCFVIRPGSGSTSRVAAIVPVNTWMAYNYWPSDGSNGPTGLTKRLCFGNLPGNNSAYSVMGDGSSSNHYPSWLRPCPPASPFAGVEQSSEEVFSVHAPGATKFFEWLDEFFHSVAFGGYDVFTDWDLDADAMSCPIKRNPYDLVFTLGHHEYWSRNMMARLNDFANAGGSLINVGGNVFGYRAERSGNVLEIKAWPLRLNGHRVQGHRDAQSLIAKDDPVGSWTGFWRLLNEYQDCPTCPTPCPTCVPPAPGAKDDFVLGTIPDLVGVEPPSPVSFGVWEPVLTPHWLWGPDPPPATFGTSSALDGMAGPAGTVGHEADSYVPYVMDNGMGVNYVPSSGGVQVLAMGSYSSEGKYIDYYGAAAMSGHESFWQEANLEALFMATQDPDFMDDFALFLSAAPPTRDVANITYYHHTGGGCVLSIPTTACAWALGAPGDSVVKNMVQRAMRCFLQVTPLPPGCDCGL